MICLRNVVYFKMLPPERENGESEETKIRICKLCLQRWKLGNMSPICINDENISNRDAIVECFSEVDILTFEEPLFCPNCIEYLGRLSKFLRICSKSEEIIKDYIKFSNDNPRDLDMFDVFLYKRNQKNSDEQTMSIEESESGESQNSNEYVCDVKIKEEYDDCLTIEENELPDLVKLEYSDHDESFDDHVECDVNVQENIEKEYRCYHCSFKTHSKATLVLHLLVHQRTDKNLFKCESCDFTTRWITSLRTHKLLHKNSNEVKTYQCKKCKYQSIYKKHVRRHMETHNLKKYECKECTFKTKSLGSFKTHNKQKHNKKIEILNPDCEDKDIRSRMSELGPNYKCSYCTYETHKSSRIKEHISKHLNYNDVKWYKCLHCSFKSRYKASINHHNKLHIDKNTIKQKKAKTTIPKE